MGVRIYIFPAKRKMKKKKKLKKKIRFAWVRYNQIHHFIRSHMSTMAIINITEREYEAVLSLLSLGNQKMWRRIRKLCVCRVTVVKKTVSFCTLFVRRVVRLHYIFSVLSDKKHELQLYRLSRTYPPAILLRSYLKNHCSND